MDEKERIEAALLYAAQYGGIDGAHHKMWVIDQMVRSLTGCELIEDSGKDYRGQPYTFQRQGESDEYTRWVEDHNDGDDGPDTYTWDTGIAP